MQKTGFFLFVLLFFSSLSYAQGVKVSGVVTDINNESIPGVTIMDLSTSQGTITDINGVYELSLNSSSEKLKFSFIGMETTEVSIAGRSVIDVVLKTANIGMEELVVVGYGTRKKSDIISSVVTVKPESVLKVPSTDVGEMLRGKTAGVFVSLGDGGPGSSSNILIRGKNSINGDNAPIVIADGVPVGSINDVNPNDIASLEVLKDAAAQAIYGARASNGVILITTKRAVAGKAKISYAGYYGLQTVNRNFDVYSGQEFAQLKREAFRADNNNVYVPDAQIFTTTEQEVLASGDFVNWEDELLEIAPIQNHNLSIATGNDKTKVFTSFNYTQQDGVVPGTDYQKMTIRINVDQKITDWLALGANTSWQLSQSNDPGTNGTLQRTITTSPLGKIYNEDGTYALNPTGVQESFNPLLDLAEVSNEKNDRNDIMNVFLDVTPFKDFKYRMNASRRSWNRKTLNYQTGESLSGVQNGGTGQGSLQYQDIAEWQIENVFTYDIKKSKHSLNLTGVQSVSEKNYSGFTNSSSNIPNDLLGIYGLESAEFNTPSIDAYSRGLLSFVGRAQYDYDGKYYATVSTRADASTVFGDNNKWGYFPATAIGWNIYREDFMKDIPTISNLKLRSSYGSVGNEAIDPYQSLSTASSSDYVLGGSKISGYVPGNFLPNPDLRWETSTTFNLALDFGVWENRIAGSVEYYNTRTKDLLVQQALNAGLGYTHMMANVGEIENEGVELNLNTVVVDKGDWFVSAGVSLSRNRNQIISLYGEDSDGDGQEDDDVANRWFIGQPIDVYYQYQPIGIFQQGENIVDSHQPDMSPGDLKLYDRDPIDGLLNEDDKVITSKNPDWYGSFNYSMKYKNIDFSFDLLTVQGVTKNNPYLYDYTSGGSLRGIFNGIKQDYWTPENPTAKFPQPSESDDPRYIYSMGLQDASYLRLQNISLGYTLPEDLIKRAKLSHLRVYVTGHNLFTITDYESYSPEKDPDEYPEMISIVGGIQLSF